MRDGKQKDYRFWVVGRLALLLTGILLVIIADVWAISIDQVIIPQFEKYGSSYLRQYALGFWLILIAGTMLTVWCFSCHSSRPALLMSAIAFAHVILFLVLYIKPFWLQKPDVFRTYAFLFSTYLYVLWTIISLIKVFWAKKPELSVGDKVLLIIFVPVGGIVSFVMLMTLVWFYEDYRTKLSPHSQYFIYRCLKSSCWWCLVILLLDILWVVFVKVNRGMNIRIKAFLTVLVLTFSVAFVIWVGVMKVLSNISF